MATVVKFNELDWHVPDGVEPNERGEELRRARITQGDAGFHAHVIDCPPGTVLKPHSHDQGELFLVIGGSCVVEGQTLRPFDTIAIPAGEVYGLTAGDEGLQFLIVRAGAAKLKVEA